MATLNATFTRHIRHLPLKEILERKSAPAATGCRLWLNRPGQGGYGYIQWNGKNWRAHRLSWMAHRGPIPDGMVVCHKCDVPLCINPEHLFLGTQADNNADRSAKGRTARRYGEMSGTAKLSEADVIEIRRRGGPAREIARDYNITMCNAWKVLSGKTWKHLL